MKNVTYKIIMGCYIVAALVLVTACNDSLDIQQAYPFSIETLPVRSTKENPENHGTIVFTQLIKISSFSHWLHPDIQTKTGYE